MQFRRRYPTEHAFDDLLADAERDSSAAILDTAREQMRPRPAFARELEGQLATRMAGVPNRCGIVPTSPDRHGRWGTSFHHWGAKIAVAMAIILVLSLGLGAWWIGKPAPVSAATVLQKALATAADPAAAGVRSFHIKMESSTTTPPATQTRTTTEERWGMLPDRWRTEYRTTSPLPFGPDRVDVSGSGSDGTTEWSYDTWRGEPGTFLDEVEVRIGALRAGVTTPQPIHLAIPGGGREPGTPVQDASGCYHPKLTGEATVAGRAAYVIDLGPFLCPASFALRADGTAVPGPVTPAAEQGRHTMWVDKMTYFTLKTEIARLDGILQSRQEVTEIAYNVPVPPSVFAASLPAGVGATTTIDLRPQAYELPSHPPYITDERLPLGLVGPPQSKP